MSRGCPDSRRNTTVKLRLKILTLLRDRGPLTCAQIAERLSVSSRQITPMLNRLRLHGCVRGERQHNKKHNTLWTWERDLVVPTKPAKPLLSKSPVKPDVGITQEDIEWIEYWKRFTARRLAQRINHHALTAAITHE